jgi:nucleoside-diphosphate-sugar epimerase
VFSRIHVDDIVQTLGKSMRSPQPRSIYNVADDEPSESSNLIQWGAELLHLTPPTAQLYSQANLSPMAASFWSECRRIRNTKIKLALGVQLMYPTYREGLQAIFTAEAATQPSP